jgi:hypothetical protein
MDTSPSILSIILQPLQHRYRLPGKAPRSFYDGFTMPLYTVTEDYKSVGQVGYHLEGRDTEP